MDDKFLEKLTASADRVDDLLQQHFEVQEDIFKPSLRKIVPLPGFYQPVNYGSHGQSLMSTKSRLDKEIAFMEQLKAEVSMLSKYNAVYDLYTDYLAVFKEAIEKLIDICGKMVKKAKRQVVYPKAASSQDFGIYLGLVKRYGEIGKMLAEEMSHLHQ